VLYSVTVETVMIMKVIF